MQKRRRAPSQKKSKPDDSGITEIMQLNLGGISTEHFLGEYWQKKPLLIRQVIPGFSSFISTQELFDLSRNDNVEARLVIEKDGEYPWQVLHGPFTSALLDELPPSHWSLLVQNMELHRDEAAELLASFNFIPNWRIDDLMVSIAPDHGSVGPHLDSYDVFLLQAVGRRRWQINVSGYSESDFIPGLDLRILERFEPTEEWILEPGDMLYLPPRTAHYGVALDKCQTLSIGMRTPTAHELIQHCLEDLCSVTDNDYYTDPGIPMQEHAGEITGVALERISTLFQASLPDEHTFQEWFGKYITRLPEQFHFKTKTHSLTPDEFMSLFQKYGKLKKHRACRTVFIKRKTLFLLFINGYAHQLPLSCGDFVHSFTGGREISIEVCSKEGTSGSLQNVLRDLYNQGILHSN